MDHYFCLKVLRKRITQRSCIEAGRNKTERKTAFKHNAKHALHVKPYAQLENSTSEGRVFALFWQRVIHLLPESLAV